MEARERLEELLALGTGSPSIRAKAKTMVGSMSMVLGDFETAQRVLEESLPVHRRFGDVRMISATLGLLAVTDSGHRFGPRPEPRIPRGGSQRG